MTARCVCERQTSRQMVDCEGAAIAFVLYACVLVARPDHKRYDGSSTMALTSTRGGCPGQKKKTMKKVQTFPGRCVRREYVIQVGYTVKWGSEASSAHERWTRVAGVFSAVSSRHGRSVYFHLMSPNMSEQENT